MTALFAALAAPAPGTDLVCTNNQDAAYAGRQLFAAGQAATARRTRPLRIRDAHVAQAHCSRAPARTAAEANREVAPARRQGT